MNSVFVEPKSVTVGHTYKTSEAVNKHRPYVTCVGFNKMGHPIMKILYATVRGIPNEGVSDKEWLQYYGYSSSLTLIKNEDESYSFTGATYNHYEWVGESEDFRN